MPVKDLNPTEREIVKDCLRAAVEGPFFPDWEFSTLFGLERDEVRKILESWPHLDEQNNDVVLAINNSFNNLIGYPHGLHDNWSDFIPVDVAELARIFSKWRGKQVQNYFDGWM